KRQRANVGADEPQSAAPRLSVERRGATGGAVEHRRRTIDANQPHARSCERERNPAGATSKFEHASSDLCRDVAPERYIFPAERACILPVVKRRVRIPACPTFSSHRVKIIQGRQLTPPSQRMSTSAE